MPPLEMSYKPNPGPVAAGAKVVRSRYYYNTGSDSPYTLQSPLRITSGQIHSAFQGLPADSIAPGGILVPPAGFTRPYAFNQHGNAIYSPNQANEYVYDAVQAADLCPTIEGNFSAALHNDTCELQSMSPQNYGHPPQYTDADRPIQLFGDPRPLEAISKGIYPSPEYSLFDFNLASQESSQREYGRQMTPFGHNDEQASAHMVSKSVRPSGSRSRSRIPDSEKRPSPYLEKPGPLKNDTFQVLCFNSLNPEGGIPKIPKKKKPSLQEKRTTRAITRRGGACSSCKRKKKKCDILHTVQDRVPRSRNANLTVSESGSRMERQLTLNSRAECVTHRVPSLPDRRRWAARLSLPANEPMNMDFVGPFDSFEHSDLVDYDNMTLTPSEGTTLTPGAEACYTPPASPATQTSSDFHIFDQPGGFLDLDPSLDMAAPEHGFQGFYQVSSHTFNFDAVGIGALFSAADCAYSDNS